MRLWSLHPNLLDRQGLVALWREGLLARAVLRGATKGYTRHPQLQRFQAQPAPLAAIDAYLHAVVAEAATRGYRFDGAKLGPLDAVPPIVVTTGQLAFEWTHLQRKLAVRDPLLACGLREDEPPPCHPLFRVVPGPVAGWERP